MPPILIKPETVSKGALPVPVRRAVRPDEAPRRQSAYGIDEEELVNALAQAADPPSHHPGISATAEQVEVSSLWLL